MNTPIADFIKDYEKKKMSRLHMPGHKGQSFLGCEAYDLTEVSGADALYEADGIIAESEKNAADLFGTARTVYSTEGSSQCIRAMLYLVLAEWKANERKKTGSKPVVVASRNVHKVFVYAAALLDFDVVWLYPDGEWDSICSCQISEETLSKTLDALDTPPAAVYVTSPDYLGNQQNIGSLAAICHEKGTVLAVDHAHGAYQHFIETKLHPIDLGADICCDSAHKTLPVLTGGAYLQISKSAPQSFVRNAKQAMALFGSTSPSYLILASLDLCNRYLAEGYSEKLKRTVGKVETLREQLQENGWQIVGTEATKVTIRMPEEQSGIQMAQQLRKHQAECEFADPDYVVLMFTPENEEEDYQRVRDAFGVNVSTYGETMKFQSVRGKQVMPIREVMFSKQETILTEHAVGRVCGTVTVSCPPAIPIVVSGELIDENAVALLQYYGIEQIDVVIQDL